MRRAAFLFGEAPMPFDIRVLTDDDLPRAVAISGYSFNAPRNVDNEERTARARKANRPDWYLGTFEDGAMTSMMCMLPVAMYLNGAAIPFGAVSPVATAPEHRRKGHAGQTRPGDPVHPRRAQSHPVDDQAAQGLPADERDGHERDPHLRCRRGDDRHEDAAVDPGAQVPPADPRPSAQAGGRPSPASS